MKGVIMAGGRFTRLKKDIEKPMLKLGDRTLLDRSAEALNGSSVDGWLVACSRWTPRTAEYVKGRGFECMITSGSGYHEDALELIDCLGSFVSVNVDVPFITGRSIETLISNIKSRSLSAVVPADIVDFSLSDQSRFIGDGGKEFIWVGLNYVTPDPETDYLSFDDPMLAVNINSNRDLRFAEKLLHNTDR